MMCVLAILVASQVSDGHYHPAGMAVVRCQAPGWMYSGIALRNGGDPIDGDGKSWCEFILTAKHCVDGATNSTVSIRWPDETTTTGKPHAWVKEMDGPALLRIERSKRHTAEIARTHLRAGKQKVWAMGYPAGTYTLNYQVGTVSAGGVFGGDTHMVLFSGGQRPGYSGGPLFARNGQIAGIASRTDFQQTWHCTLSDIASFCAQHGIKPALKEPPWSIAPPPEIPE